MTRPSLGLRLVPLVINASAGSSTKFVRDRSSSSYGKLTTDCSKSLVVASPTTSMTLKNKGQLLCEK